LQHPDQYADVWAKSTGNSPAVARRWFARAQIHGVPIDDALVADQQSIVDLYAKAGVINKGFSVSQAFDRSFNIADAGGKAW
jgi:sulfonate transport system substrate-binding protein